MKFAWSPGVSIQASPSAAASDGVSVVTAAASYR